MFLTAAAILSIALASPADAAKFPPNLAPVIADVPVPAARARAYNPRVCIQNQITGSRIPMRECRPLAQWRTLGIDPLPGR